ncbi:protein ASYMMETRIC LEAVES 2-like [Phragmites australis]|uniref:protein ASYMMETRIC LEAVES 2-like n=1 Tax=Phragmites australis TaxID=29695 RepID=UPI002D764E6B|nr:protein ASYMMETRIC LEAVES 2-like [Phragmites australis]
MSTSSSPCAACKLLRRKCTQGCVFAPYFPPDNPSKFANVHRVFGASNVSKLLNELPHAQREDAVNSLAYEADARLRDPVYGCVSYISILQLKIKQARDELAGARKDLAGYIGPAAFAPFVTEPQYHHNSATQYAAGVPLAAAGMRLGFGVAPQHGHPHPHHQIMVQHQHLYHQQLAEAQQLVAAVDVAREQDLMMRHAAAYAHAVPGSSTGATVAVVPPDAVPYESGFLFQQQPPVQAQTAVALTYQIEPSPPPSSSGQSPAEVSRQQHTDASDEGNGGVVQPA